MFDFGKKGLPTKKIQERQTVEVTQLFGDISGVVCNTCQRSLSNEESMIAGMGAVCRERARFSEKLERKDLPAVEGKQEPISKGLYPSRNVIIRLRQETTPRFVSIISVNNISSVLMDRTEMSQKYKDSGSMAEAIADSIYSIQPHEAKSVAPAVLPKEAKVRKEYNRFQRADRKKLKERVQKIKKYGLDDTFYNVIDSKKSLTQEQKDERDQLAVDIESDAQKRKKFQEGFFHLATLYTRLDKVFMPEAKKLKDSIYNKKELQEKGIEEKDYGLTDFEILEYLTFNKNNEKTLVNAFFRANKNLPVMIELFNKSKFEKGLDKVKALKTMKIFEKSDFSKEDINQINEAIKKFKINKKIFL